MLNSLRMNLFLCASLLLYIVNIHASFNQVTTEDDLYRIQQNIQNNTAAYCHGQHSATKHKFLKHHWQGYLEDRLAIVYPFCLKTNELGNRLGNYFNELGCAEVAGVHFITIHNQWDVAGSFLQSSEENSTVKPHVFLRSLPEVVVHPKPNSSSDASAAVNEFCQCTQYCWQDRGAPWLKILPSIKKYTSKAIVAYYESKNLMYETVEPNDITNAKDNTTLPIIPDVAIQYRCGDNLGFSFMYGILPFHVFPKRIPSDAKYIYVMTDHPARSATSPYAPRCKLIIEELFLYLTSNFPNATVLVKRGGDMFLDYARLSMARVTICSASTYCLWPAIASNGTVHFPISYLIAGVDTAELTVNLTSNFNWIMETEIITNFNKLRPWTRIIDVLKGNEQMPK